MRSVVFQQLILKLVILLNLISIISAEKCASTKHPKVETKSGPSYLGSIESSYDGDEYYSFQKIPYAQPPTGNLRFMAPIPPTRSVNCYNATVVAPVCPQYQFDQIIGDEDCLYLNVYSRTLDANKKLPVMVYIHGGAYAVGSGNSHHYGPEFLMTHNIVLVTLDYRLGTLGSLSFADQSKGVPGNAHLKDQVMALRWVRDNIAEFGGDPHLVTVFGESVGGASVHMHLLSPMSRGLVHRVIAQSGTAFNAWNHGGRPGESGEQVAQKLGITVNDTREIIEELQKLSMEEILKGTQSPGELYVDVDVPNPFGVVLESQTNEAAFLPKPVKELVNDCPSDVPMLMGYNNKDPLIFQVERRIYTGQAFYFNNLSSTIPMDLPIPDEMRDVVVENITRVFFPQGASDLSDVAHVTDYATGPWFISGSLQTIEAHVAAHHPLYMYVFASDTKLNFFKRRHPVTALEPGASHMDELGYLFTTGSTPWMRENSVEDRSWRRTVKIWTDFARTGNPDPEPRGFHWEQIHDAQNISYVLIENDKLHAKYEPSQTVFNFWRHYYHLYSQ